MQGQWIAVAAGLTAGVAGGLQIAVNGAFGARIGFLEAAAFASILTMVLLVSLTLLARGGLNGVTAGLHTPPWLWAGGLCSAILVTSVTFAAPRIGGLATAGLLIAGQLCIVFLVDMFGWFGLERVPLTLHRAIGLPLLAVAGFLVLKR